MDVIANDAWFYVNSICVRGVDCLLLDLLKFLILNYLHLVCIGVFYLLLSLSVLLPIGDLLFKLSVDLPADQVR